MPIVLPDPDEVARMDWHARDKAIRRARRLLYKYAEMAAPADHERWRSTVQAKRVRNSDWAAAVREEARVLLHDLGPDPMAAYHWAQLDERQAMNASP